MSRKLKIEKIRNLRPITSGVDVDCDMDSSEYLASEIAERLKYPCRVSKNRISVQDHSDILVQVTDFVIIIDFEDIHFAMRWAFDGDLTDSDINEIAREINNRISQNDDSTEDSVNGNRASRMRGDSVERVVRNSKLCRSALRFIEKQTGENFDVFVTALNLNIKRFFNSKFDVNIDFQSKMSSVRGNAKDNSDLPECCRRITLQNYDPSSANSISFLEVNFDGTGRGFDEVKDYGGVVENSDGEMFRLVRYIKDLD